jgi:Dyp-type peroxidase family
MAAPSLELDDIQGVLLHGYVHHPYADFLFLTINDPARARNWLRDLTGSVTTATTRPAGAARPSTYLNVAFTYPGLINLGFGDASPSTFPQEFYEGMADDNRAHRLGDVGANAPEKWEFGGPTGDATAKRIHVLLMLYGDSSTTLTALSATQRQAAETSGLTVVWSEASADLPNSQEHFGFHDSISQPIIEGSGRSPDDNEAPLKAGEFILGYPDEYNPMPLSPQASSSAPGANLLAQTDTKQPDLGRNGTYLVFRKLEQDVAGFWRFMAAQTNTGHAADDASRAEWLAAKCVGRWPSGTPLVVSPEADLPQPSAKPDNTFRYTTTDAVGLRCPVGAHIRRANPRDTLPPDPADSLTVVRHHRLMRRGRDYGKLLTNPRSGVDDGVKRGLLFIALNANLARQFEFVQQTWLSSAKFNGLHDNMDPVVGVGNDRAPNNTMTIPADPARIRVRGVPQFVTLRGGGYFFLPGIRALRFLSFSPAS